MFKKVTLRLRLTIMTALLITVCCVGLTFVLNFSANRLVNSMDAVAITTPATPGGKDDPLPMLPLTPTEEVRQAKQGYRIESILYMLIAVLLGSGLTYFVVGKALKPVKQLSKQVKNRNVFNLSEQLQLPQTQDEIADLTQSFNEMTDKLHESFQSQQRFSANVAHELRTPLTVLQTKIDVFYKKNQHSKEEYDLLLTSVQHQTGRLRELIKSLLDMTNREDTLDQVVPLNSLFKEIIEELSGLSLEKQVTILLECHQEKIYGNIELLYRVFYNLVENAIKYNVRGGTVQIKIEDQVEKGVFILISDTGMGIPDEFKKQVFEPFYRITRSQTQPGTGLGLAMVDHIIKKYQATIAIADNLPQGTCFKITFPNKNFE